MPSDREKASNAVRKVPLAPGVEPVPGYRLVERLGRGGFGEVWKALGPGDVPVAIKIVTLDEGGQVEERAMEVIKAIRHPHLLPVFGIWRRGNKLIVAMELGEKTLLDRFNEAVAQGFPGIPAPEIHEHFADAARGLDFLNEPRHAAGPDTRPMAVQHRDIKPQNILLVGGSAKIADFGLARVLESSTSGHSGSMTPTYAAPEFFAGKTSSQSDQYSLAITYCHLRGGRPPFSGTIQEVMMAHVQSPPDLSMLPEHERPAVARALSKKPKDRWPNCRAFIEALKPGKSALPVTLPLDSTSQSRRRSILTAMVSLMVLVIATTAIAKFWPRAASHDNDDEFRKTEKPSKTEKTVDSGTEPAPISKRWVLKFDGVDDAVRTPEHYRGDHPVTFEAVIIPGENLHGPIVAAIRQGEKRRSGRGIGLSIGPGGRLAMLIMNEERMWLANASEPLESGRRTHVAGCYHPGTRRLELYIDGVLKAGLGNSGAYQPIPQPIMIGNNYSRAPGPERAFAGRIEWVRVSRTMRRFDGNPVSLDPPEPDDDTTLLLDFTKGEDHPPVIVPKGGQVTIVGPKWVQTQ